MDVPTDYGHFDELYARLRREGAPGWTRGEDRRIHHRELLRALDCEHCPDEGRAIELGCGAGDWCLLLAREGFDTVGVDLSPRAIDWAKDKADQLPAEVSGRVEFHVSDVLTLSDRPSGSFDFVLDGFLLHCLIGDDRATYLRTAARLLRPGGMFFLHAFAAETVDNEHFGDWIDPETRLQVVDGVARRQIVTPEQLLGEVRQAGLEVLEARAVPIPAEMWHVYATR